MSSKNRYRFGDYELDVVARELHRGGVLVDIQRMAFDALTFLVEQRARAVNRDELIATVWDHADVEDIQVTQLIMRLRRTLGDDSQRPRYIRTVSGFGYRWIADIETVPAARDVDGDAVEADPTPAQSPATVVHHRPRLSLPIWLAAVAVLAILLALLSGGLRSGAEQQGTVMPMQRQPGQAVVVLPIEVEAPDEADAGWLRLGAMDLIATRLRRHGLPVPPSDSVVAALHGGSELAAGEQREALYLALDAGIVIEGSARLHADGWVLELIASAVGSEDRRRIEAGPAEPMRAAGQAAQRLLAALGHDTGAADPDASDPLDDLLQRSRAATLALELDVARAVLDTAPETHREAPELRIQQAWIEFRAGRIEQARRIADALLADPKLSARGQLHAEILVLRAHIASRAEMDWRSAVPFLDAAIEQMAASESVHELGVALASRGAAHTFLHQFDLAVRDLGRARALLEASGDRLAMVRINNYLGHLELERGRLTDALPHFSAAIQISEAFAHADWMRANLLALLSTQSRLLRWPDALVTAERLDTLFERTRDPVWRNQIPVARASTLLSLGQLDEARSILAAISADAADLPKQAQREIAELQARLHWTQERWRDAHAAAGRGLALWPRERVPAAPQPDALALLHQRASIRIGSPQAAEHSGLFGDEESPGVHRLIARAEWAHLRGDHERAEAAFVQAVQRAETAADPAVVLAAADAFGRWLLARGRAQDALAMAGRVADWSGHDYQAALLQAEIHHANGQSDAWAAALARLRTLAGERRIPAHLRSLSP